MNKKLLLLLLLTACGSSSSSSNRVVSATGGNIPHPDAFSGTITKRRVGEIQTGSRITLGRFEVKSNKDDTITALKGRLETTESRAFDCFINIKINGKQESRGIYRYNTPIDISLKRHIKAGEVVHFDVELEARQPLLNGNIVALRSPKIANKIEDVELASFFGTVSCNRHGFLPSPPPILPYLAGS